LGGAPDFIKGALDSPVPERVTDNKEVFPARDASTGIDGL
jgi:hypothetical protein